MLSKCTFIIGMSNNYDDEQRLVLIDERVLHFGPCQYTLLALLLEQQEVDDITLAQTLYQQEANRDTRALITRHISKLRIKLQMHDLDIQRIHNHGYKLVSLKAASV